MLYQYVQGERVPALGFGTYKLTGAACREAVEHALDLGYRHLDTAAIYGNEDEVGAGWTASGVEREDFFLTTKVWYDRLDAEGIEQSAHESLRRLRTDYVDLLLVHWPSATVPLEETLDAMFRLHDAGKVRQVGVSNFPPALLRRACTHGPIFCNQVEYHPYLSQSELIAEAEEHDLLLTAYSPLAKGRVNDDPVIREIADYHGKMPAQVTLRWLMQQPGVAAIPKAASARHRADNFDVFDFSLSDEEVERIGGLAHGLRLSNPAWAPDWD